MEGRDGHCGRERGAAQRTGADIWDAGGYASEIAGTAKSTNPGDAVAASGDAVCANQ